MYYAKCFTVFDLVGLALVMMAISVGESVLVDHGFVKRVWVQPGAGGLLKFKH